MRPDKNKADTPVAALAPALDALARDLTQLEVFLAAYRRSAHPQRTEAVRWLVPILTGRLADLRGLGRCDLEFPPHR